MGRAADFLAALFAELASRSICCCVLRSYDELPAHIGRDVDMWVAPSEARRFSEAALQVARANGWRLTAFLPRIALRPDGNYHFTADDASETANVDLCTSLNWKGIPYLGEDAIRRSLVSHPQGFRILRPEVEGAAVLVQKLLWEGLVPEKYRARLGALVRADPEGSLALLQDALSQKTIGTLRELIGGGDWPRIAKKARGLRREFVMRALGKHPFSTLRPLFLYLLSRIKERARPKWGAFVVLLGPDGSGKTTMAHALLDSTASGRLFFRRIYLYRRFPLFPELKWFAEWARRRSGKRTHSRSERIEEGKPFTVARCVMYVSYYGIEYALGRLWLWWQFGKHRALVVSDRYFHEYALQRQFERCPRWLLASLMKIITRPDALIYLRAAPELSHARKGEQTVEELRRQCTLCEGWVARAPHGYVVDSVLQDVTLADLQKIVIAIVTAKQARVVSRVHGAVAAARGREDRA